MANEQRPDLHNVDLVEELEQLLNSGANINERNAFDETPLMSALRRNVDFEVLRYFIRFGADVNAKDCWGVSPLYCAAVTHGGNLKLITLLLDYGADIGSGKGIKINDRFLDYTLTHDLMFSKLLIKYKFLRNAHLLGLGLRSLRPRHIADRDYYEEYKSVVDLDLKPSCYFYLRDYLDSCASEVVRMLTVNVGKFVTLWHFITANSEAEIPRGCDVEEIKDVAFAELMRNDYPIYSDIIADKIGKEHLARKMSEQFRRRGKNLPYHVALNYVVRHLELGDLLLYLRALK